MIVAAATALGILQTVMDRLAIGPRPDRLDLADDTQRQMLALTNEEGQQLAASFPWQQLVVNRIAPAADNNGSISDQGAVDDLCPGLARIVDNCLYLDGRMCPLVGPVSISARTSMQAGGMALMYGFFVQDGHLYITGPTSGEQSLRIAYVTRYWVRDTDGNGIDALERADDTPVLNPRLLVLGTVWRWLSRNGLPYQQEWLNYDDAVRRAQASDTPRGILSASGGRRYDPRRFLVGGVARPWA